MTNITRFNTLGDTLDDLFRGFLVRPLPYESAERQAAVRMDVSENPTGYVVRAELPGVKKDEIQVSIDGNEVSIRAEIKHESEAREGEHVIRSERYYGKLARRFQLAQEIDESQAAARFTDGVLELALPKKAPAASRVLAIQ